jgi:hypothetical protein
MLGDDHLHIDKNDQLTDWLSKALKNAKEGALAISFETASEFARKLSDNGVTISFLRKGKEAVRLGKDAKPTLSKMVTGSDDIQLNSAREFAKLKGDLKTD